MRASWWRWSRAAIRCASARMPMRWRRRCDGADVVVFLQRPELPWDAGKVVGGLRGEASRVRRWRCADRRVARRVRAGDHVVFMSNGGFDGAPRRFLAALRADATPAMPTPRRCPCSRCTASWLPGARLTLRIFERRYLDLVRECGAQRRGLRRLPDPGGRRGRRAGDAGGVRHRGADRGLRDRAEGLLHAARAWPPALPCRSARGCATTAWSLADVDWCELGSTTSCVPSTRCWRMMLERILAQVGGGTSTRRRRCSTMRRGWAGDWPNCCRCRCAAAGAAAAGRSACAPGSDCSCWCPDRRPRSRRSPTLRDDARRRHRDPGTEGRQLRPHRTDARSARACSCVATSRTSRVAPPARLVAGATRSAALRRDRRHAGHAAAAALGRPRARSQLHGRRGDVPAAAARRCRLFPPGAPPAAAPCIAAASRTTTWPRKPTGWS